MPIIQITLLEGREQEMVEQLLRDVARTVHKSIGAPLESIRVYVNEVPKNYYAIGDKLKSELEGNPEVEQQK
jgi:4-oxalocrotonate tautomerase